MRNVFGGRLFAVVFLLSLLPFVGSLLAAEDASFERAVAAFDAGDYENAARQYEGLIEQSPGWAPGIRALGQCYYLLGRPEEGRAKLERAHELDSGIDLFKAYYGAGQMLYNDGNYDGSIAPFEGALDHADSTKRLSVVSRLGHAYLMTERFAEAKQLLEGSHGLDNRSRHHLALACQRTDDYDCALSTLRALFSGAEMVSPAVVKNLAEWSHYWALLPANAGRRAELLDQAALDTRRWFETSAEEDALRFHAEVLTGAGRFEELIDAVLPRARGNDDDCAARLVLARAHNAQHESVEAETWARETIACEPESVGGRLELAAAIMGLVRVEFSTVEEVEADLLRVAEASEAVDDASRLDPDRARAASLAIELRTAKDRLEGVARALRVHEANYVTAVAGQRDKETRERCRSILWKMNDETRALSLEDQTFYDKNDCKQYAVP